MTPELRKHINDLTKKATDDGLLIEVGWLGLRLMTIPEDAPQIQLDCMKEAFFAGAQHVFGSVMTMLDPDEEPTEADMRRIEQVHNELNRFIEDFTRKHNLEMP
jgi:hypothetical protein